MAAPASRARPEKATVSPRHNSRNRIPIPSEPSRQNASPAGVEPAPKAKVASKARVYHRRGGRSQGNVWRRKGIVIGIEEECAVLRGLSMAALAVWCFASGAADERLAVELDAAITGFETARAAAESDDRPACAKAVKALNDRWMPFYKAYRDTATMDAKWKTDFDAVKGAIELSSAMLSREEPLSAVAGELAKGKAVLETLRTRNDIPVPQTDLDELIASLEALETAAAEWQRPGSEAPAGLAASVDAVREAWEAAKLGRAAGAGRFRPAGAALEAVLDDALPRLGDAAGRGRPMVFRNALTTCLEAARGLAAARAEGD